ncbi:MAG: hypothetical protein AAF559_04015 [Pseudomonadota bacterium]
MTSESAGQSSKAGFLGRGPWFWLSLTAGSTAAIVGLKLSGAIEKSTLAMLLMVIPLATFLAMIASVLRLNESGSGECVQKGEAQRRYIKRVAVFTSLYLATFAALTFLDQMAEAALAARFIVAALPGIAISGIFWAIARLIVEEKDEFIRMLTIRQTLIASGFALSAASIWGFLEAADLVIHLDAYWVAVAWFVGLFFGALANRIEHGTWGAA